MEAEDKLSTIDLFSVTIAKLKAFHLITRTPHCNSLREVYYEP